MGDAAHMRSAGEAVHARACTRRHTHDAKAAAAELFSRSWMSRGRQMEGQDMMSRQMLTKMRSAAILAIGLGLLSAMVAGGVASAFAAAGGGSGVTWRNEGFRPGDGWTTGEIGPYQEGDMVPLRFTVSNPSSTKSAVVGGFSLQVTREAHGVAVFDRTTDWTGPLAASSQDGVADDALRTTFPAGMVLAPGQAVVFTCLAHLAVSAPGAPAAGLLNGNGVCGFSELDADGVGTFGKRVPVKVDRRTGTLGTPAIDIETHSDAAASGVPAGTSVTYTFVITNIGDVSLYDAAVTDSEFGAIGTLAGELAPGETRSLTHTAVLSETTEDISTVIASDAYGREATDESKCSVAVLSSARVFGSVFADDDKNGAWDATEAGWPGWPVQLCDSDGNVVASTVTDALGAYAFEDLSAGVAYTIVAPAQAGFIQTAPADGVFMVTLTSGQNAGPFDFGEGIGFEY